MFRPRYLWRIYLTCSLGLILLLVFLLSALAGPSATMPIGVVICLVALLLATILYGLWSARRLSRSVRQIADAVERLVRENSPDQSPSQSVPDPDSLTGVVNNLARHLRESSGTSVRQRQEYETIVANMIEGVFVVSTEEHLVSINQAAALLLGVDRISVIGRSLQEVIRNSELQRLVTRTLSLTAPVEGYVTISGKKDRHLQVTGTTLRDNFETTTGALIVLNDITHLRNLEQVRRDFVANVSHELKTPITSIKGYIETLLDGALHNPEDAERFLKIAAKQANRLNAIIEDLLKLSRIEQGAERGEIILEQASLRGLLTAAVSACETQITAKNIHVSLSCPDDLVARINPPLLEQVVVNLIDNAAKYGNAESTVEIVARRDGSAISITVSDHGVGIAPEHLPRLFERFYRVDKARSRAEGGTGLGLAIAKHIVLAHGGTISVDSRVGEGSTFTICLPLR